jgi:hypothetical protein
MPMGIVNNSEFEKELNNLTPPSPSSKKEFEIVDMPAKGRGNNPEVPDALRKVIGETSAIHGREEAIEFAKNFGISPSSVSAYANGSTSTTTYDERPNANHINGAKERIGKKALNKLALALGGITKEKLSEANARTLAGIAKDMSAVVKNMEPDAKSPTINENGPQFIFYAPQYRKEEHYDVVQAKE